MKDNYSKSIALRCITCGGEDFNFNEDRSYAKCNLCNREYLGGYDELVELNQENISENVEAMKNEIQNDLQKELSDMFKDAFKGNKYVKFK
ncbi:hypothetical protein [uncultured Bacteroides sp.]|uniref:ECs_2282 family putative zinc-binding protein n=1 Tax=uncultured Bacteroides sp. TaxID=162156 RepID=UPI002AAC2FDF|nr:hypothetical protein [uncultured Bacteroides sp.]